MAVGGLDLRDSPTADVSVCADVSDEQAVPTAVGTVIAALGRLDAVVSAAGAVLDAATPLEDVPVELVRRTLEINTIGAFLVVRECLPAVVATSGAFVLVASAVARSPQTGVGAYAMAKAGVVSLMRSIALEYAGKGVRANSVSPGYMDTAMARPVMERASFRAAVEGSIPLGRVADPREVARLCAWLASPESSYVSGEDIVIDGAKQLTAYSSTYDTERLWASRPGREETP